MPLRSRRACIQRGDGALASTPSITRDAKRGHAAASSTTTRCVAVAVTCAGCHAGGDQRRAGERGGVAGDAEDRQAVGAIGRDLERDERVVEIERLAQRGAGHERRPAARSSPDASSASPSSRAEHSMPSESTPRIVARRIVMPPGSVAPSRASGASMPAAALGAPQTIVSGAPPPASTVHTRRRSAPGCGATATMRATTTPANAGAAASTLSTSRPPIVSASASVRVSIGGSHSARSQCSENFIARRQRNCARKRRSFS